MSKNIDGRAPVGQRCRQAVFIGVNGELVGQDWFVGQRNRGKERCNKQ